LRGNLLVLTRAFFVDNEIHTAFLLNSQAQGVSGKNEKSTQTPWRGAQCSCIGCIGLRPALGVGAGKFWVLRRIYARIRPNSPEKFLCDFSLDIKTFFGVTPKKGLTVFFFGFGRSQMLAAIFVQIFRDFSRIFDKSKLLWVRLITPCPSPPTPLK